MAKTKNVKNKKHTYDGIELKSSLELYCYKKLKENGFIFEYEPESITLMDGFRNEVLYFKCTNGSKTMVDRTGSKEYPITYKPDFVSHEQKFYIETKGFVPSQHTFTLRWKLFLYWLQINGMSDYKVFLPKNQTQVDQTINILLGNEQETIRVLPDVAKSGTKKHNKPVRKFTRRKRKPTSR